ncbi:MAG: Lrp/AsnC family transcriptional regulator [Anaerolineae bacterium]|jgi:Lrp/AsnC family transcriptional regulator for asnA, asnC and gidA
MDRTELDRLDRDLIRLLQYDGRTPFTQLAEHVDVTEGTVRRRVSRLLDSGIMQIVAVVEPQFLGWAAAAMVGVGVEIGKSDTVANRVAQFPEVSYLFQASGEFDLFVEVYCKDREHFVDFLNNKLHRIPGILSTRTFMILKMYKLSYRWGEAVVPHEDEEGA